MKLHPVLLLGPSKVPVARKAKGEITFKLPFRITSASGVGVIRHSNGAVSQVIQCDGPGILGCGVENLNAIGSEFVRLVREQSIDLQLLLLTSPFPMDEWVKSALTPAKQDDYAQWSHGYLAKWLVRISEVRFIPEREFYVVVTHRPAAPPSDGRSAVVRLHSTALRTLQGKSQQVIQTLDAMGCKTRVLDQQAVLRVIYRQVFLQPDSNSVRALPPPPRALTATSLPEANVHELAESMQRESVFLGSSYISQLPAATTTGWLADVLGLPCNHTLSVHISHLPQAAVRKRIRSIKPPLDAQCEAVAQSLIDGTERAVRLSIYATVCAGTPDELAKQNGILRDFFARKGAVLSKARGFQLSTWLSCLCSGLDAGGVAHLVPALNAADCFALFDDRCGDQKGSPLGVSYVSQRPAVLDLRGGEKPTNLLLLGANNGQLEHVLGTLIWREQFLAPVLVIDNGGPYRFLTEVLGDVFSYYQIGSLTENSGPARRLSIFNSELNLPQALSLCLEYTRAQTKPNDGRLVLVFPEIMNWLGTARDAKEFSAFLAFVATQNASVILATKNTKEFCNHKDAQAILRSCKYTAMLEQHRADIISGDLGVLNLTGREKAVLINRLDDSPRSYRLLMRDGKNSTELQFLMNPMEYWLCGLGETDMMTRKKMLRDLYEKTPKLNSTDLSRQAVYYLGLSTDELAQGR